MECSSAFGDEGEHVLRVSKMKGTHLYSHTIRSCLIWNSQLTTKRGVYKPVRTFSSALVASLTVFVASGLFHEWLVHAVLIYNRSDVSETVAAGEILIGSNTAFFVWNFVVIVIERLLSKTNFMKTVGNKLPRLMVTFSIIMTSLPFAHW